MQGAHNPYHHFHSASSLVEKESSCNSDEMSMEEEELVSTLVKLQEGATSEITPAGRPKRSKRKRFDSDDYVFEDDLMAKQEVSIIIVSDHSSRQCDAARLRSTGSCACDATRPLVRKFAVPHSYGMQTASEID